VSRRSKDQDLIDKLTAWMQPPDTEIAQTNGHAAKGSSPSPSTSSWVADEVIIEKCRAAKNAPKFEALFDHGDAGAYHGGDASGADYALLGILKLWTQDPDQLERLMRRSRLARPKWDEGRAGRSWLRYSIENALKDVGEVYDWEREGRRRRHSLSSSADSLRDSGDDDNNESAASGLADLPDKGDLNDWL
jgi:primase-polymerase (primpol)-like protein